MTSIDKILENAGVTGDVAANIVAEVNKNYRTLPDYEKQTGKVTEAEKDRDLWKEKAETAATTLKTFEGKDIESIEKASKEWQEKYETLIKDQEAAKEKAELDTAIQNAITAAKGRNAKAIIANLDMDVIKASKNRDKDIESMLHEMAKAEATAFLFETDPEVNRAQFTAPAGQKQAGSQKKLKDMTLDERMRLKATNPELYKSMTNN